ncbi:MAG: 3D domain-containing protein [Patescibacteria group bacterium]
MNYIRSSWFVVLATCAMLFCIAPVVFAAPIESNSAIPDFKLQVPFSGYTTITPLTVQNGTVVATGLATYLGQLYAWLITAVSIIAVVMLMVGGLIWLTSRGNSGQIGRAKKIISNALIGLVLSLSAYSILYIINPTLVQLPLLRLGSVEKLNITVARIGESADINSPTGPAGRSGNSRAFDAMSCPSISELSFDAYVTQYYKPQYGDKGSYSSFSCNIGMQCDCPNPPGRTGGDCGGWKACGEFSSNTPYCNGGAAAPNGVRENHTLAADLKGFHVKTPGHKQCYRPGCKATINGNTYIMEDVGSAIKGRHFDLYAGTNYPNNQYPKGVYTVTLDPASCF